MDEIMYPSAERKGRGKKLIKADEPGQSTLLMFDTCAEISTMAAGVKQARLAYSGMPIVAGNNCNDNKLFINDMPFWWSDEVSDITDEELVMNASVLIDALEGRLKLVPMPDIQSVLFWRTILQKRIECEFRIVLDPIEDVKILQTRDNLCFKKEHIFGNTIRSMVNLNELSIRSLQTSSRKSRKVHKRLKTDQIHPLEMLEPTTRTMYARDNFKEMYTEDYTPSKTIRYQYDPPVAELERD
ncbi:hypothetical protein COOONC_16119 [Cooperia oncophora]